MFELVRIIHRRPTCSITVFSHHWGPIRVMAAMILAWSTPSAQSCTSQRDQWMNTNGAVRNYVTMLRNKNRLIPAQQWVTKGGFEDRRGKEGWKRRPMEHRPIIIPAKGRRGVFGPGVPWVEPQWPVQTTSPAAAGSLQRPAEQQPGSSESAQRSSKSMVFNFLCNVQNCHSTGRELARANAARLRY